MFTNPSPQQPNQSSTPSNPHLPTEILLRILYYAVLPPPFCPAHLFGKCFDPWSCPYGLFEGHDDSSIRIQALRPSPNLTSVSHLFQQEAYKIFYSHNLFTAFPSPASTIPQQHRLVNTVADNTGSLTFEHCLRDKKVDEYRHLIRHLVLRTTKEWVQNHEREWGWPLQVDFAALPNLETLYLDLRPYSAVNLHGSKARLDAGLQRLAGLELKNLVLVGCCSYELFGLEPNQQAFRRLFMPALRAGRKLLFWDEPCRW